MTVFIPLDAGAQVEIIYQLAGVVVENRLWFVFDNPPYTITELQGLRDGVYTWHTTKVLPFLSSDIVLTKVLATSWFSSLHFGAFTTASPVAGGVASPSLSANVSVVVPFRWTLGERKKRNKNYVPGIAESDVNLNQVSTTLTNNLFEAYVDLIDDTRSFSPSLNWRWVVTSSFENNSPRSTQYWQSCQGPPRPARYLLGQRRTRLD